MTRLFLLIFLLNVTHEGIQIPVNSPYREITSHLDLTEIGAFGLVRKERPGIPAHYHTGIDIKRPTRNYMDEPIYSLCDGVVISKRADGPYAQLIIEHDGKPKFWTVYEHISGIKVKLFDKVSADIPIARFMNKNELDKYGWQFDHFHFEILKVEPIRLKHNILFPERHYSSYSLLCYTEQDLHRYFYHPIEFLEKFLD